MLINSIQFLKIIWKIWKITFIIWKNAASVTLLCNFYIKVSKVGILRKISRVRQSKVWQQKSYFHINIPKALEPDYKFMIYSILKKIDQQGLNF